MTGLLRAAHAGPALAVVVLTTVLAADADLSPGRLLLVAATVLAGQLTVGWSNDLVDERRDRAVGRLTKPLVAGSVARRTVLVACGVAVVATVVLSLVCGGRAAIVHLACVASAWAYNLRLKSTWWSWAPYAFSFAGLPVFVALVAGGWPPWWVVLAAALLGVGAHLLNVLPDLADDATTGVRGLPHRLGPGRIAPVATVVLLVATVLLAAGVGLDRPVTVAAVVVAGLLAAVVLLGRGRLPFLASILVALTNVVLLVAA